MNEIVQLKNDTPSAHQPGYVHAAGTQGMIVAALGKERWLVQVQVSDPAAEDGVWTDVLDVRASQLAEPQE